MEEKILIEAYASGVRLEPSVTSMSPTDPGHLWITFHKRGKGRVGAFVKGSVLYRVESYAHEPMELRLLEGMTEITSEATRQNPDIQRIFLPRSLAVLGKGAFLGCTGLEKAEGLLR